VSLRQHNRRDGRRNRHFRQPVRNGYSRHLRAERLEDRAMLSTFTVINTDDAGLGSLRQAIVDANGTAGLDTIEFNIGSGGVQTIVPITALPSVTDPVIIDGWSQPGFAGTPIIEIDGSVATSGGVGADGLLVSAGGTTVRGLVINRFGNFSDGIQLDTVGGNIIEGNYIGTDVSGSVARPNNIGIRVLSTNNRIGTNSDGLDDLLERNLVSGNGSTNISIGAGGNIITGNFIGPNAAGTNRPTGSPGANVGISLSGNTNTIGGTAPGAGNLISGNAIRGVEISGATGTVVQGNWIGTTVDGLNPLGNGWGIGLLGAHNTIVGGSAAGAHNVISGNSGFGVNIGFGASGTQLSGNSIGLNADGTALLGNHADGVFIQGSTTINNMVNANVIAGNDGGVRIFAGVGNTISQNSIYSNEGPSTAFSRLGIDLGDNSGFSPTPNDLGDADVGPNRFQNFPLLAAATPEPSGGVNVTGSFNSTANGNFTLEFFANVAANESGFGEGQRFLGSTIVATDAGGNAGFAVSFAGPVAAGEFITATATNNTTKDTSEFSQAIVIEGGNDAPVAEDDSAVTDEDTPLIVDEANGVLANDMDADGDTLSAMLVSDVSHGTLALAADGSFSYTPDPDFNGNDAFTYQAVDSSGGVSNTATVSVAVAPVNDAPVADDLVAMVTEDGQVAITLSASDAETSTASLLFTVTSLPAQGQLSHAGTPIGVGDTFIGPPTLTYEPGAAREGIGNDSFGYTVTDVAAPGASLSDEAVVAIGITQAAADGQVTVDGGVVRVGGTSGNDDILITRTLFGSKLQVRIGGQLVSGATPLADVHDIRVWSRGGNDKITVFLVDIPTLLHGGVGDDLITGGLGSNLMFGGDGSDKLIGGVRDDLLVGGTGSDMLLNAVGDDVLFGGNVAYQLTDDFLRDVLAQWQNGQSQNDRFTEGLADDEAIDSLFDSIGDDWFVVGNGDLQADFNPFDQDVVTNV
jgi:VCBS repeat-containing protein